MATIRDVARMAEVSISTVSLALNDPDRVKPETREKVLKIASSIGYSADPIAQTLKSGRSKMIGVVVTDINNPFFGNLLHEIEQQAYKDNYMVLLSDTGGDPARELAIMNHMAGQRVAGILLSTCVQEGQSIEHIRQLKMPCVLFDQQFDSLGRDFVGSDNELAAAMLTRHLLELGHRDICMLGGATGIFTSRMRANGFIDTMRAAGIEVRPDMILDAEYRADRAYDITLKLFAGQRRPTAIVAASNVIALGALQALKDLAIDCPEDVSLVGIDDVPWSGLIVPKITSAVQQIDLLARKASQMLMRRIAEYGKDAAQPETCIFSPKLVMGGSTAKPPSS
ncbi:LacI family DNA-binding transcriptional regulator [Devosia algicola]|uniref:LacI family DNA-binding transcriptional regulator n=1 Tax=Devosia algicola TaxID=3026418 RepID=A0ABY7YMZ1_9HYPH|nr:LacI family DNA-binding transcriptional regulator [Devosia algicola]WDR02567.1 LacI family DNA-binding transcriptional regulator [Devosia algicola]